MIGLTINGRIYTCHFLRPAGGAAVVVDLKRFGRHIPGPLLIPWDHSKPHLGKVVQEYLVAHPEIHVEWLPPLSIADSDFRRCDRDRKALFVEQLSFFSVG